MTDTAPAAAPAAPAVPPPEPTPAERTAALLAEKGLAEKPAAPPKEPEKPVEAKKEPTVEEDSALAKRLARIAREEARVRKQREEVETQAKAEATEREAWKKFKAAKTEGKKVEALRSLFSEEELHELYQRDLTDWVLSRPTGTAPGPDDVEALVSKKVAETLTAKEKAQETERAKHLEEVRTRYIGTIDAAFKANATKYPMISAWGVSSGDIHTHVEAEYRRTGQAPTAEEVLDHFEKAFASKVEAAGYTRKQVEAQGAVEKPSTTVTQQWTRDNGAPETTDDSGLSYKEAAERIKKRFFKS